MLHMQQALKHVCRKGLGRKCSETAWLPCRSDPRSILMGFHITFRAAYHRRALGKGEHHQHYLNDAKVRQYCTRCTLQS